ncbi:cilia- and flagella-associated protein 299-like [Drosophila montana]|uniref:cilia- and flagella-associated protein 299-like n=1 Tax=Drosophila montana TaxID=40370 RepID=UPI00313C97FE
MAMRGDLNDVNFGSYGEYMKSFTKVEDYRYLGSKNVINALVKVGYRTNATVYEEHEFYKRRQQLKELTNAKVLTTRLYSTYLKSDDPALVALAEREAPNVLMRLSTIIFLQIRQRSGFDISGYIDYADSLRACSLRLLGAANWQAIFEGRTMLRPNRSHLSFYDWHSAFFAFNNSENYEVINYKKCLMFKHTGDHKFVPVTTTDSIHKDNVKRTFIESPLYGCVILYDHFVRK